jgi:hypothetical protein
MPDHFQIPLRVTERKLAFPIYFRESFEQLGDHSNIFHVVGLEKLSDQHLRVFVRNLQHNREAFRSGQYSLVFWVSEALAKRISQDAPDFFHWILNTYDFTNQLALDMDTDESLNNWRNQQKKAFGEAVELYLRKVVWQYENWATVNSRGDSFVIEAMSRCDLHQQYIAAFACSEQGEARALDSIPALLRCSQYPVTYRYF